MQEEKEIKEIKEEKEEKIILSLSKIPLEPKRPLPTDLREFVNKLKNAKNIIVMIGAGVSVSAGIPDFRTPGTGLYSQLSKYNLPSPESIFDIEYFKKNPEPFRKLACELWPRKEGFKPTPTHYFIKMLHDNNKLLRCYSQNIDSLETIAGLPKDKLVAAHGNFDSATCCLTKIKIPNIDEVRDAYLNNTHDELNKKYGTKLVKPDIVFFGEELPKRFLEIAIEDGPKADMLIVMGTSLTVQPFASLTTVVKIGTPRLLINNNCVGTDGVRGFDFRSRTSPDVFFKSDCDKGTRILAEELGYTIV